MFDLKFDNIALLTDSTNISYAELKDRSSKISKAIDERCLVFSFCTNSVESIEGYVGFLNHRIVPAMLDANLDSKFVERLLDLYRPSYLWIPKNFCDRYPDFEKILELDEYALLKTNLEKFPMHEDLALLMSTSGSTGSPKFVRLSYENLATNADQIIESQNIDSTSRAITSLPMNYVYGLSVINSHLRAGGSIVVTSESVFQKKFWDLLTDKKVTNLSGVPYTFEMLDALDFFDEDFPDLNLLAQAGGRLSSEMHLKLAKYAEDHGKKFFAMYGASEATARMSYLPPNESLKKIGSIGIPVSGGRFELLDSNGKIIENANEIGELIYHGKNVMMGYSENYRDLRGGGATFSAA